MLRLWSKLAKTLNSLLSWHDLILNLFAAVRTEMGLEKVCLGNIRICWWHWKCVFVLDRWEAKANRYKFFYFNLRSSYWFCRCFYVAKRRGEPSYNAVDYARGKGDCRNYSAVTELTGREKVADTKYRCVHPVRFLFNFSYQCRHHSARNG